VSGSARKQARRGRGSDRAPTRVPLAVSFAELARTAGVARSTITRACAPGGPMHPAVLSPGRVDAGAACVVRWLAEHAGVTPVVVDEPDSAITPAQAARLKGAPVEEIESAMQAGGALASAVIHRHHVSARVFAVLSGSALGDVIEATRSGSLVAAVTENGRIDLSTPASLEWCARRPYPRLADGEIDLGHVPEGGLVPAMVGDQINIDSPFAHVFVARCCGRVPTEADLAELAAGGS
jgi:hypothetical protein